MKFLKAFVLLLICLISPSLGSTLEEFKDDDLKKLINQEQYVIVLFSDESEASHSMEAELAAVREDLVETINAWVVKAVDSQTQKLYAPDAGPQVVFFRQQQPVLYDGPANEDEILETLMAYKEPCSQTLSDGSFEHLTQAATGATTGDWLIEFYKEECEECQLLRARLETVACKHRGRINVARVDKGTTGAVTGRRFGVSYVPSLIFFRLGRMYRYTLEKYDVASLSSFITGWYKNVPSESIPLPKTPFDDLVQMCVDYLRDYPLLFVFLIGLPVLLFVSFVYLTASTPDRPKSKKTKKSKKSDNKDKDK